MKIKLGDIIIICLVLVFALLLMVVTFSSGETVYVEVDGKVINTFSLSEDNVFTYEGEYTNVIKISSGEVYIEKSDCPDKTCVHTGKIDSPQKVICCLPNRLVIRIAKGDKTGTDVISG